MATRTKLGDRLLTFIGDRLDKLNAGTFVGAGSADRSTWRQIHLDNLERLKRVADRLHGRTETDYSFPGARGIEYRRCLSSTTLAPSTPKRQRSTRSRIIRGYAARTDCETELIEGLVWETLKPGCFREAAKGDVRIVHNHDDSLCLGRTGAGTAEVKEDGLGLHVRCELPNSPLGDNVREMVSRGDVSGMSFGFTVGDETWHPRGAGALRAIVEIKRLWECSPCTFPQYEQTEISLA